MKQNRALSMRGGLAAMTALIVAASGATVRAADRSFIGPLNANTTLSTTIPPNGDVNPYGITLVPRTTGKLVEGHILISNFNDGANLQGTGTTIVEISPSGNLRQYARIDANKVNCPGGVGLTTALAALDSGFVIVGSLPTTDGTSATAEAGCLIVLNSNGDVVETFTAPYINGPWDMTVADGGQFAALFFTNVLNGTVAAGGNVVNGGTVVRLILETANGQKPRVIDHTVIGSGFRERTDAAALVIGPTGVAFDDETGTLFVADSLENRIAAIPFALFRRDSAGRGLTVFRGGALNDPLGLALTPNHHLIAANGDDGYIVEVDPFSGRQVAKQLADDSGGPPPGGGALFGLIAVNEGVYYVDDATNTLNLLH